MQCNKEQEKVLNSIKTIVINERTWTSILTKKTMGSTNQWNQKKGKCCAQTSSYFLYLLTETSKALGNLPLDTVKCCQQTLE